MFDYDFIRARMPGWWLPYIEICGKLTWTVFLNLLPITYCGGVNWWCFAPLWCMLLMVMNHWWWEWYQASHQKSS